GVDYEVEHAGDRLRIVHNDGAPSFALAQAPLTPSTDPSSWEELLVAAEGERLLTVEAVAPFVALELRTRGLATVRLSPRGADGSLDLAAARDITHAGDLDTVELDMNPGWEQELVRYQLTSRLPPPTVAQTDIRRARTTELRRTPVPNS